MEDITKAHTTEPKAGSREIFYHCSAFKEPEECKKFLLGSVREEHNQSSSKKIKWTPGQTNVAKSLSKVHPFISRDLDDELPSGVHKQDKLSYAVSSDVPSQSAAGIYTSLEDDELSLKLTDPNLTHLSRTRTFDLEGQLKMFWPTLEGKGRH